MIRITYDRAAYLVTVSGHAGAGKKGHDIVCAAVSALVLTLAENLQLLHNTGTTTACLTHIREGAAKLSCCPVRGVELVARCIFDTVCRGFALVQQMHPKFVSYQEI